MPEAAQVLLPTFVALCLGALVGLERQIAQEESQGAKDFPGVRTFAFVALVGALSVLLAEVLNPWISVALFAATVTFLVLRYSYDASRRDDPGYTTEIASLCTFAVGGLAQANQLLIATVITIAMVALLRSKRVLHRASDLLSPTDLEHLIRFLVISGIVLPLLPNEPIDPWYAVLSPRDVWWKVVLISGLGFSGYLLLRFGVGRTGFALTGMLGGLVSSTAATFAYGRAGRGAASPRAFEGLIGLAVTTSFLRLGVALAIVAPALLPHVAPALGLMTVTGATLVLLRHRPSAPTLETPSLENPLSLRAALTFAALYAGVLLLVAAVQGTSGTRATLAISGLAGLMGADAPSLSLARLASEDQLPLIVASVGIIVAACATTLAKIAILAAVSGPRLALRLAPTLVLIAAVGLVALRVL
jgi:uncharacterized membrane protein (DUF4010 family)